MSRPPRRGVFGLGVVLVFLSAVGSAQASPPQINGITPFGVQRGMASELTVDGLALSGNPRLIAPFGFVLDPQAPAGSSSTDWKTKLTVDPSTAVGVYPIRVQTDEGLSNPFLLAVGQLPQVSEKEDNSTFETAQEIATPVVVEGKSAGNDVDYFRFHGKKGQRIVLDAQCSRIGSGVDPSIRLTTADRTFVASADDSPGLLTDARLFVVLPVDGEYVIELSDSRYQGGGRPVYRLVVGEVPAAEEVYPLGGRRGETLGLELRGGTLDGLNVAAATLSSLPGTSLDFLRASSRKNSQAGVPLDVESLPGLAVSDIPELREPSDASAPPVRSAVPVVLNGRIDPPGDEDRYVLAVTPGQRLRIEVDAAKAGSALDGVVQVLSASGSVLATADDTATPSRSRQANAQPTISPDPSLDFTVPSGTTEITLALRDLETRGGVGFPYRISVTTVMPGFDITLNDSQLAVPKGGSAAVGVTVVRKGYSGPITLKLAHPPDGLSVRPGTIAETQLVGSFTVAASREAEFPPTNLEVIGEAQGPAGSIVAKASKMIIFAQQTTLPTNTIKQVGIATALTPAQPVEFDKVADPVEVAHGLGTSVKLTAVRPKGDEGPLALTALPLPPGLTVAAARLDAKATEVTVPISTTTDHPLGMVSVVFLAKGKVAGSDRTLTVPAVTLNVVRPASVELESATVELKPGASTKVKGKVVRRGGFKEPVTVKVNGLPTGVKAGPVTVAPDDSGFTLELEADEKAAAGPSSLSVATAFQVNKKDYPAQTAALALKVIPAK
jgi:hypothetical protein